IQTNIIKTPYDFSTVDSSQVRLAEGKSVLDSYNAMVKNLKEAQTEKEDAVNANKQLVSNLAHDLKSPITILKGYAEVLGTQELTDKERKEYISYIYKSSNDLNNLLNLLFEQVKYGSPDIKMNLVRTDINAILRQSCANYYMLFDNRGFDFNVGIPEEECFVYLDSVHINRVFSNLLQNVLNHNSVPSPVCVSSNVEDGNCVIRFMDDGVGINSDNKEKIFQPFFQEDSSRNKQNSGLGLYVVRQIMLNHEGNIELESSEDFKTIFKLTMKLS
ncbi:MAG: HAMP domain-containing sensor histidine kinase, partial [Oscillospiraceae bacterium]